MTRTAPLLALLSLAAAALAAPAAFGSVVPCTDPRGCPDLVVDTASMTPVQTVEYFFPGDCAVVEGMTQAGLRTLVRFNFASPNVGAGDLIVGDPSANPDWFEWSPCHRHYHFKEYADYRLWTLSDFQTWDAHRKANPSQTPAEALAATGLSPVEGHKQGFCVIDIAPYPAAGFVPDPFPKYLRCNDQGISRGWADVYDLTLDGQWVDVTGVAPGAYVLEAEVNAERLYVEQSYSNNRAWIPVVV